MKQQLPVPLGKISMHSKGTCYLFPRVKKLLSERQRRRKQDWKYQDGCDYTTKGFWQQSTLIGQHRQLYQKWTRSWIQIDRDPTLFLEVCFLDRSTYAFGIANICHFILVTSIPTTPVPHQCSLTIEIQAGNPR